MHHLKFPGENSWTLGNASLYLLPLPQLEKHRCTGVAPKCAKGYKPLSLPPSNHHPSGGVVALRWHKMTTAWGEDLGLWDHEVGMSWLYGGLTIEIRSRNWLSISKEYQRGFWDVDMAWWPVPSLISPLLFESLWGYGFHAQRQNFLELAPWGTHSFYKCLLSIWHPLCWA